MSRKRRKNKKKSKDKNRTGLGGHRQQGKTLNPPFLHHTPGMSFSSWKDDRMPEMLWAVLAVGRAERDYALAFFRYVLQYANDNKIEDLTLTGISKLEDVQRDSLIQHICDYSSRIKSVLRPILLFDNLPARNDWVKYLPLANPEEDWTILAPCIVDVFDHQSQKATDCRWVKLMPAILTGKMKLNTRDAVENLLQYPNRGDMHAVRPYIRASEIAFPSEDRTWSDNFWKQGLEDTICIPFEDEKVPKDTFSLSNPQLDFIREHLVEYFIYTDEKTAIDPKHEAVFGIVLLSMTLLEEMVATNLSRGSLSRIVLRNISEAYINLAYLIKKDDPKLWQKFRDYGIGQMKLASLKHDEDSSPGKYFDSDKMHQFANEDRWEEFSAVELGNWSNKDLRKISEEAGCKDVYDRFYNWPSSYTHSGWGAIRESVMTKCANPMHRFHLLPRKQPSPMKSTLSDTITLVNKQLDLLQTQYKEFPLRIIDEKELSVLALILTLNEVIKKKQSKD